jgi:hypothetical protein
MVKNGVAQFFLGCVFRVDAVTFVSSLSGVVLPPRMVPESLPGDLYDQEYTTAYPQVPNVALTGQHQFDVSDTP